MEMINIPVATSIPILIKNTFTKLKYFSFSREYCVSKDVWIPIIGSDSLTCDREEDNENDKNTVAVIWDGCVSKKIVGHVKLNWSKVASKFLQFTNHHILVEVTGKTVKRGVRLGLKIPVNYLFVEMQEL